MEEMDNTVVVVLEKLYLIGQQQLSRGNLKKAKTAFEYALKKSYLMNEKSFQESALVNLAATCLADNKPAVALNYLQSALDLAYDGSKGGDIHYNVALAQEQLGHNTDAAQEYNLAISAYKTEDAAPDVLVKCSVKAGMLLIKLGKYRKATEYLDIAAAILSEKELISQLATVLCMKAQCLVASDKTVTEAIDVCDECVKLCGSISAQDLFTVNIYNELGLVLTQSKQFEKAAECYKAALSIVEQNTDDMLPPTKRAALLQNLGAVLNSTGNFQDAANYSQQAANIYGTTGVRSSQCHCFLNMAYSYGQLKTPSAMESCEESYLHALQAAKDTDCHRDQWQALEGLAGVSLYKNNAGKAVSYLQKAVGICAALGSNNQEQDRLVGKLSSALRLRALQNGGNGVHRHPQSRPVSATSAVNHWQQPVQSATPHSSVWSQTVMSESQAAAASAAAVASTDHVSPTTAQYIMSQPVYTVSANGEMMSPATVAYHHRPLNPEASRQPVPVVNQVLVTDPFMVLNGLQGNQASTTGPVRRRKGKRIRKLSESSQNSQSHRRQSNLHPIHGAPETVHRGLGGYHRDYDGVDHLDPELIHRRGRRRRDSHDSGTSHTHSYIGLKIKGLAVTMDEPDHPMVGGRRSRRHEEDIDVVDGDSNVLTVRPMSRQVNHRRSTLTGSNQSDQSDNSSQQYEEVLDAVDEYEYYSEGEEEYAEEEEDDDTDIEKYVHNHRPIGDTLRHTNRQSSTSSESSEDKVDGGSRKEVQLEKGAAENPVYGSVVKERVNSEHSPSRKGSLKGKRAMSGKLQPRKFSKVDVRKTNLSSSDEEHGQQYHYKSGGRKDSLLHVDTPPVDSDAADHQAVKEHMQRLNNLEDTTSSEEGGGTHSSQKGEVEKRMSPTSDSTEDRDLNVSDTEQRVTGSTYMKPKNGNKLEELAEGGNYFQVKGKKHVTIDPIYETIPTAEDTAPAAVAPPQLPPRNYGGEGSHQEGSSDDGEEKDIADMTRGEREQFLYEQQQKAAELTSNENDEIKKRKNLGGNVDKRNSKMCSVM